MSCSLPSLPSLYFTTFDCNGNEVEVVPGGKDLRVTLSNRHRYCDAVESWRLHEFDTACAAIRRGLANIVPIRALSLFRGSELEVLVCGSPDVDVALFRSKTRYEGYSASDPVIKRFWKVLTDWSPEERCAFLRWLWGRSRLPPEGSHWTSTPLITRLSGGDKNLPMAHVCFSSVELPAYTSVAKMRRGLEIAIAYSTGSILNA